MPHHADPATPGPRVTGPAGLSTEFSWGGRMPSPRGWTPMSAHLVAPCPQNSQTRVLPMSQDRGLSVFNQSMVMTNQEFDADCRHCGGRLVLPDADRRSAVRTACPSTSRRGELSPHQNSTCAAAMPRPLSPSRAANKALERPARMLPASHAPLHPTPTRIPSTCGPLRP